MNPVYDVQADIYNSLTEIVDRAYDEEEYKRVLARLNQRIKSLELVRDKYACNTLITSIFMNVMQRKMCLAYCRGGLLYCTAKNVPGRESTEYLHTLGLSMDEWDKLPRFHVWIHTGDVFGTVLK